MSQNKFPTDEQTKQVEEVLQKRFASLHPDAQITVYRYNPVSIRARIISEAFRDKSIGQRDREIASILEELPDETYEDVSFLLCLTPDEVADSIPNFNFERPYMPAI